MSRWSLVVHFTLIFGLTGSPSFVAIQTAFGGEAESKAETKPHLLFVPLNSDDPKAPKLAESEKLTIQAYRDRGVLVTTKSETDLRQWLEGDGKPYLKAQKNFQWVAYAKQIGAHAVGGLDVFEVDAADGDGQAKPTEHIHGWGYSLSGMSRTPYFEAKGMESRAVPIRLCGKSDPWAIPMTVEPGSCSPGSFTVSPMAGGGKGRPFMGVGLDGNRVNTVRRESPAAEAGLQSGDILLSFKGTPINEASDLTKAMEGVVPGDEVEIEFKRGEETFKKKLRLADRHELVEVKQNQEGKALPPLTGKDIDGRDVRLDSFKGKVILLDFWATWCGPCREEMPLLQLLSEKVKDRDFIWVGVSVDDDKEAWESFVRDNRLGGIQVRNPEWADQLFVSSFPTVLLVDRTGMIRCKPHGEAVASSSLGLLAEKP